MVVGSNTLDEGGESYSVEEIINHPQYTSSNISNDIALIKLKDEIKFNERVQPIQLPTEDTRGGENLMLSGWGSTSVSKQNHVSLNLDSA